MIADYFKEMQQYETIEVPETGFVMYRIFDKEFHVGHFYVVPEKRRNMNTMAFGSECEKRARELGCEYMTGIVTIGERDPKTVTRLIKNYIQFGCEVMEVIGNTQIIFKKDLV